MYTYINQQEAHKILEIRLYFLLDALHVSDYISPSSGETFNKLYIHLVSTHTKRGVQLIKVAPEDGLI